MLEFFSRIWEMISTAISMLVEVSVGFFEGLFNVITLTYNFIENGVKFVNSLPAAVSIAVYGVLSISVAVAVLKMIKLVNPI